VQVRLVREQEPEQERLEREQVQEPEQERLEREQVQEPERLERVRSRVPASPRESARGRLPPA
jgi:hypothetical protein